MYHSWKITQTYRLALKKDWRQPLGKWGNTGSLGQPRHRAGSTPASPQVVGTEASEAVSFLPDPATSWSSPGYSRWGVGTEGLLYMGSEPHRTGRSKPTPVRGVSVHPASIDVERGARSMLGTHNMTFLKCFREPSDGVTVGLESGKAGACGVDDHGFQGSAGSLGHKGCRGGTALRSLGGHTFVGCPVCRIRTPHTKPFPLGKQQALPTRVQWKPPYQGGRKPLGRNQDRCYSPEKEET